MNRSRAAPRRAGPRRCLLLVPKISQLRYAQLATYHNGPGDYGDFGIMVYNGQTRNRPELNYDKHVSLRLAHPFELPDGRLLETGLFAYRGQFVVDPGTRSRCPVALHVQDGGTTGCQVLDERLTWYLWTPPQPSWGLLWNTRWDRDPRQDSQGFIRGIGSLRWLCSALLHLAYSPIGLLTTYVRYGEYYGGIKTINGVNGRSTTINLGLVWN